MTTPIVRGLHVLGVTINFETNSHALATLMEGLFPPREHADPDTLPEARSPGEPMLLRVDVGNDATPPSGGCEQPHGPATATQVRDGKLFVSIGGSSGVADRAAGVASAVITPDMALNGARVQTCFLEPLALFIACRERPVTLHAAAVVHEGRCVLLTGRHGAGKSTLAYACVRSGFGLLAEDIVFSGPTLKPSLKGREDEPHPNPLLGKEREPDEVTEESSSTRRFWGRPSFLHLLPDAVRFFPELAGAPIIQQLNGEHKIRVDIEHLGVCVDSAIVWGVCSLSPSDADGSRIRQADKAQLRDALTRFEGNPLLNLDEMKCAVERLLRGRIAHLEVGRDPAQAVEVLRQWIETD